MTYAPKRLGQLVAPVAPTTFYTVPADTLTVVKNVVVANTHATSSAGLYLSAVPSGGSAGAANRLVPGTLVAPLQSVLFDLSTVLAEGDLLVVSATLADALTVTASGVEESGNALSTGAAPIPAPSPVPIGSIVATARSSAPADWLLCDGAVVSRATYAALFDAIGTAYGAGDGSTTFALPNLKGRVPVGLDPAQTEFDALAETGGAKTVTLGVGEMPAHAHTQNAHNHGSTGGQSQTHAHAQYVTANVGSQAVRRDYVSDGGSNTYPQGNNTGDATADHTHAVNNATPTEQNSGGGGAHQNMPPFVVVNYLIRAA